MNYNIREYAMLRNQVFNWDQFVLQNPWALDQNKLDNKKGLPKNCVAIYHRVNASQEMVEETLYLTTWDVEYKADFKQLSLLWVTEHFKVEESDVKQLDTPEQVIILPGGEIFFLLDFDHRVTGVVAMVLHGDTCELAKMTVRKECTGRGYAHILMRESINWAKSRNYPSIELMSNLVLENAILLYKKYGFETVHLGPHPNYARCNIVMRLALQDTVSCK
ncbi:N-acetylaspartate synthetase [Choanephora cucurbitarum]|uniref:N-acetylaspartate synthetase n=1 Tax=Choanephora cucurbitarum TaxID=101091 RepID=A0A1C7NKY0_9FUNG|nr:N-acetylaspartate synthetase [Choanephora cucurbitarum]